jgi:hypothetical protein
MRKAHCLLIATSRAKRLILIASKLIWHAIASAAVAVAVAMEEEKRSSSSGKEIDLWMMKVV